MSPVLDATKKELKADARVQVPPRALADATKKELKVGQSFPWGHNRGLASDSAARVSPRGS